MHALLSAAEPAAEGWISGEWSFESAVRPEWGTDAALRELSGALPSPSEPDSNRDR
jgi:hypothetical protein